MVNWLNSIRQEVVVGVLASLILVALSWAIAPLRRRLASSWGRSLAFLADARLGRRLRRAGVTNFYVGRSDWVRHRIPPGMADYLQQAARSVDIACYWMAQGTLEGIPEECSRLAERGVRVKIVMVDPTGPLPDLVARDLGLEGSAVRSHLQNSLSTLRAVRSSMSEVGRAHFAVELSKSIPQAAVIAIDLGEPSARIQLEFRPYLAARLNSFSMELTAESHGLLFQICADAWSKYFRDSTPSV